MGDVSHETCAGITKAGLPCKAPAMSERGYCGWHDTVKVTQPTFRTDDGRCASDGCSRKLAKGRRLYCSNSCLQKAKRSRSKSRSKRVAEVAATMRVSERELAIDEAMAGIAALPASAIRRGAGYKIFAGTGLPLEVEEGILSETAAANRLGTSQENVHRWMNAWREDLVVADARENWRLSDEALGLIGPVFSLLPGQTIDRDDSILDLLVDAFVRYRDKLFVTERAVPFITADFHREWIRLTLWCIFTGSVGMILSPPRHGKSKLYAHFVLWLISWWPNVRIIWVGPNGEIAGETFTLVMSELETNKELIRLFCPPGETFRGAFGDRKEWAESVKRLTVATRTLSMAAPTFKAIGRKGKILSSDADYIVCDDIEDAESVETEGEREKTRRRMTTQVISRKEEHTAICFDGSRQHPDDLYGHLIDNDEVSVIVESMHDEACDLDPEKETLHVECMLFPAVRSYRYMRQQFRLNETLGGPELTEMVYLNKAGVEGLDQFNKDEIDACMDRSLVLGPRIFDMLPDSTGFQHVAGLDPSSSGYQASFYWAYRVNPETHKMEIYVIDIENNLGGGIDRARKTLRDWSGKYPRLKTWYIETNLFGGELIGDPRVRQVAVDHHLTLMPHKTHKNKRSETFGVTALAPMFRGGNIVLPYGDSYSIGKIDAYRQQLLAYNRVSQATSKRFQRSGVRADIVMASWFPWKHIQRERLDYEDTIQRDYDPSYEGFGPTEGWSKAPWS